MTQVVFTYDEASRKWAPTVSGVMSDTEARQAFNAVVLSCQELDPMLLNKSIVQQAEVYEITPAVGFADIEGSCEHCPADGGGCTVCR